MSINLKEVMKKKLSPTRGGGGEIFKFEMIGDQLIGKFQGRRTVTTTRGEPADLCDVEVLAAEKVDAKTKKPIPIEPGRMVFFLGTHLRKIFDAEQLGVGDTFRVQLCEIGNKGLRLFGLEVLERDDIPDFKAPKK